MYIKDDEINRIFNEKNWKIAHSYYKDNAITNMSVLKQGNEYHIDGTVEIYGRTTTSHIVVDTSGKIITFECNCPNCHKNELACGHIGVLLLKFYSLDMSDIPFQFNQKIDYRAKFEEFERIREEKMIQAKLKESKQLIETYLDPKKINITGNDLIELYPTINYSFNRLLINYRIGNSKTYLIKNLKEFINNYRYHKTYNYGSKLIIDHNHKLFSNDALKQITFIKDNSEFIDEIERYRSISINKHNIDEFFETYLTNLHINIFFTTIDLNNLTINIEDKEEYFEVSLLPIEGELIIGTQYIYYLNNNILNRYSLSMSQITKKLLEKLDKENLIISKEDFGYFGKYIIDQILPYISIIGANIDDYMPSVITLLIYVDLNTFGDLTINLEYRDEEGHVLFDGKYIDNYETKLPLNVDNALTLIDDYAKYDELTNMYLITNSDEDVYYFIKNILPELNQYCEVFVSEDIKNINKPKNISLNIGIRLKNNLLEIDLDSINVSKTEIQDILNSIQRKKSYHRLKNGEFINLEDKTLNEAYNLIKDLNLKVKSGQTIAIVGKTGCGKTTLINLLMRFYDQNKGIITIDDVDTLKMDRDYLRKLYGMVLQESWIFKGTIKENIAYGKSDADDEEIIAAAKKARVHKFIMKLPDGYETMIEEDGGNLSQGQKQLICIARIMLTKPPMLILDEATSSIDTRTELQIQEAFDIMMEGRTTFIVAHRLSTIKNADIILFMDKGRILEQGTHQELLDKQGYYYNLYNSQFNLG